MYRHDAYLLLKKKSLKYSQLFDYNKSRKRCLHIEIKGPGELHDAFSTEFPFSLL